jgi:predicted Zn-dependent protease
VTTSRITDSRERAEQITYRQLPDSSEFLHARAKVRALAPGETSELVRGFQSNLQQGKYANADAERYGYALALTRARRYDAARAEIKKLIERHPNNVSYRIAHAELEMAARRFASALAIYETAYKRNPTYYPLQRHYSQALLRGGRGAEAAAIVREAIKQQPEDPALYEIWAQSAGKAGRRAESHQAMAEHYYWNGNPDAAIEQLKLATRFAGNDFYMQSSLEARMQAIKEEVALYRGK